MVSLKKKTGDCPMQTVERDGQRSSVAEQQVVGASVGEGGEHLTSLSIQYHCIAGRRIEQLQFKFVMWHELKHTNS